MRSSRWAVYSSDLKQRVSDSYQDGWTEAPESWLSESSDSSLLIWWKSSVAASRLCCSNIIFMAQSPHNCDQLSTDWSCPFPTGFDSDGTNQKIQNWKHFLQIWDLIAYKKKSRQQGNSVATPIKLCYTLQTRHLSCTTMRTLAADEAKHNPFQILYRQQQNKDGFNLPMS